MITATMSPSTRESARPGPTGWACTSRPEGGVLHQDAALAAFPAEARRLSSARSVATAVLVTSTNEA
ncbi:hypothetical protein ACFY64_22580 [Streptomyces collinus]|uniref:hypothetical protein n=1 Tax=Streptomyces collinus TaxID=42684 RepID=UPI0036CE99E2